MADEFFYDLDSARKILPWVKSKLMELEELGIRGEDAMADYDLDSAESLTMDINEILEEFHENKIILRDLSEILVDFPAVVNNMPSYLCWKGDEEDIAFWHYADEGFAGRKEITGEENILSYL